MPAGTGWKMAGKETYCNFNLADVLDVLKVYVALNAVAPSVHWQSCGVPPVKYDIEAPSCTSMPGCLRGNADDIFCNWWEGRTGWRRRAKRVVVGGCG